MTSKEALKTLMGYLTSIGDAKIIETTLVPIAKDLRLLEALKYYYKTHFNENCDDEHFELNKEDVECYKIIKEWSDSDRDKLDHVWDFVEQALQEELSKFMSQTQYDILNNVKKEVLQKLKEYLENEL